MKFGKIIGVLIFFIIFMACQKKSISEIVPEYKFLVEFSDKIKSNSRLILFSYGINNHCPAGYKFSNHLADFELSYDSLHLRNDEISLESARVLLVSLVEAFLVEVESNPRIRSQLEVIPFESNRVHVSISFTDENRIELGQGIASLWFSNGKIKYNRYEISEYTGKYPANGRHFKVHEETYEEALKIVKEQGGALKLIQ